jgi:Arc/MetJ-type ribon-helix-helix transcriptional regulator
MATDQDEVVRRLIRMSAATEELELETSVRLDEFDSAMRDRMDEWDQRFHDQRMRDDAVRGGSE